MTLSLVSQEGNVSNERLRYSLDMHRYDITQMHYLRGTDINFCFQ